MMIREAYKEESADIARLIMMAMTDECCLYFCGEGYGLDDFRRLMTLLVECENTQYSYQNTIVAVDGTKVVGAAVSYDGGRLQELRQPFFDSTKKFLGKDNSGMEDETQAGELYLDSLAVLSEYRRCGIAKGLVLATKKKADEMGLPCVGLLVDTDNPTGEAFYQSIGFHQLNKTPFWGGHPMKHLIL